MIALLLNHPALIAAVAEPCCVTVFFTTIDFFGAAGFLVTTFLLVAAVLRAGVFFAVGIDERRKIKVFYPCIM